ncbi:hypothetical protein [Bacillus sp. T33-2]|uniref:hypothetical protein n=1 Tax=Bacillus sp. T33-2 TaxID=2054168 RepID=UPI000C77DCDA|nr:hypothetical protein [Bacillus sp. T33-2]PLR99603.1 hypothetical protein CVD19_00640 [Bacillus sp. T33-2]
MLKKDFVWAISGVQYKVKNVPYYEMDAPEKEYLDLDVTIKLAAIRDLMYANEIPHEVDYEDIDHIEF